MQNTEKKIIGLAPMDGITNCAYRIICKELFEKYHTDEKYQLRMRTEFMNVEGFMREPGRLIHHLMKTDFEDKTIAQIYGADHHDLVQTAIFIDQQKYGFTGIELNIGCPSPKVMSCGGGAGMMRDRERTTAIIKDIVNNTQTPFSIKTRAGLTEDDKTDQKKFLLDVAQYCRHIIIHGRTYKQSHSGNVDRDFIYDIKKELGEKCILIGNGGITSYKQMTSHMTNGNGEIQLDGVMVGQAVIGWPWLLCNHTPSLEERYNLIVRHAKMMVILFDYYYKHLTLGRNFVQPTYEWLNNEIESFDSSRYESEKTMIEYRKYLFTYISGLTNSREIKVQLAQTKDYTTMMNIIEKYIEELRS